MENNLEYSLIGSRIKRERIKQNFTQDKLAEILGISTKHMSNIENGAAKFSLPTLVNIANALKVTPDFLLTDVIYENKEYLKTEFAQYINRFDKQQIYLILEMCKAINNLDKYPVKK